MNCSKCGQHMSAKLIAERKAAKGLKIRAALVRRKADGKAIGRPRRLDDRRIRALKNNGYSLSVIADEVGTTKSGVQGSLRRSLKRSSR